MTGSRTPSSAARDRGHGPGWVLFAALLCAVGFVARGRAAALPAAEMFRSFPSEDGYLMLTVARNIALGSGMTSAAGTLPTNGVQPLVTLLQASAFWLVDGDRVAGVRLLLVLYASVAALTALLIYRLGLRLLGTTEQARRASLIGAAAWIASPVALFRTMDMLETGLYAAAVVVVFLSFDRGHVDCRAPWAWRRCAAFGALLGIAFWVRNDAVFLMLAAGLAHLATAGRRVTLRRRFTEATAMAGSAFAVCSPWLLYNVLQFGNVMPGSGLIHFGAVNPTANLRAAAVALFEQATLVASFEFSPLQHRGAFVALCAALLLGAAAAAGREASRHRRDGSLAPLRLMVILFGAGLMVFYLLLFDAPYFLRRYLFPLSPFLALHWGDAGVRAWHRLIASRWRVAGPALLLLLLGNFSLRDGLATAAPRQQGSRFRAVQWVEAHVSQTTWVGAFQSGTLGFFHDRTLNLDGKLNAEARRAVEEGRHQAYVVDSPVQFVLDWASLLEPWARADPALSRNFEWIVRDIPGNFAVLGRRAVSRTANPRSGG